MADWTPMEKAKPEKSGWYWTTDIKGEVRLLHYETKYTDFYDEDEDEWYSFKSIVAWIMIDKPDPYEPPMTEAEAVALISKIPFHNDSNIEKCLSLSYKALMKQIPKHVTFGAGVLICPICGVDARANDRYCFWCGQALEWEN